MSEQSWLRDVAKGRGGAPARGVHTASPCPVTEQPLSSLPSPSPSGPLQSRLSRIYAPRPADPAPAVTTVRPELRAHASPETGVQSLAPRFCRHGPGKALGPLSPCCPICKMGVVNPTSRAVGRVKQAPSLMC